MSSTATAARLRDDQPAGTVTSLCGRSLSPDDAVALALDAICGA